MSDPKPGPFDPGFVVEYSGLVRTNHRGNIYLVSAPNAYPDELDVPLGHYRAELRFVRVADPQEPTE